MHIHFFITQRESKATFIKNVNFTQYLRKELGFPDIIRKLERFFESKADKYMDMTIFQVESNKILPHQGDLLIAAPFLKDFYFARSVVLMIEHNEEGSMGIVMNKNFSTLMTLNELVPALQALPPIPLYRGGPIGKETLFYLHTLSFLKDALPLGNGLYVNGDFNQMQQYILSGAPTQGVVRFFMGYAGWQKGQLKQEIEENSWVVNNENRVNLLNMYLHNLWQESLSDLGGKYAVWARYPKYPIMN